MKCVFSFKVDGRKYDKCTNICMGQEDRASWWSLQVDEKGNQVPGQEAVQCVHLTVWQLTVYLVSGLILELASRTQHQYQVIHLPTLKM